MDTDSKSGEEVISSVKSYWSPVPRSEWVSDSASAVCLACYAKFWFLNRRHHCRSCGLIFCGQCCRLNSGLPWTNTMERVCNLCIQARNTPQMAKTAMTTTKKTTS
uniref:FYVE-type domain-containing protein n=2 Tax=Spongospora subterranea TaxID=70186 RepID=A0A0H5R1M7_9EUKA|eukprot:CRZ07851.1 hypothetical protein [Spongospora subterranea]